MINDRKQAYEERKEYFKEKVNSVKNHLILISFLRVFTFLGVIFLFVILIKQFSFIRLAFFLACISCFVFLVIYNIKKTELLNHYKFLIDINNDELQAINYNYTMFDDGHEYNNREHGYAYDLDLFGQGSLFQYLNRTVTMAGKDLLARELLSVNRTDEQEVGNRQKAVEELALLIHWRQNFMATAKGFPIHQDDNKKISEWVNQPVYFLKKAFFKALAVLLPIITLAFLALLVAGIAHYSWFVFFAILQLLIASMFVRRTNKEQRVVTEELTILKNYAKLLKLIEQQEFSAEILNNLKTQLRTDNINALDSLKKLIRIIDAFDTRLNIFMGVILNATLMWDLISVMRLEKWKMRFGENINRWVDVVAEFDFFISLANYSYNNPGFVNPQIVNTAIIDAKELGHPLIPEVKRVNNDFKISEPGKIEIITGANMAGKSTFLRTIGINLILAMMGAPLCAKEFNFKMMDLFTGMRTADSLKENESYFYAELKRLKNIIESLKQDRNTFLLLDEILKGTNSLDKAKGSWKFVEHLLKLQATGIIATHDLTLCDLENEYPENIENKCFEVKIEGDKISFDYKLRPGVTQNMNASLLMKQMGIFSN